MYLLSLYLLNRCISFPFRLTPYSCLPPPASSPVLFLLPLGFSFHVLFSIFNNETPPFFLFRAPFVFRRCAYCCRGTRRTPVVAVIPPKILACTFIAFDWFASSSGWNSIIHCHRDVWMALMLLMILRAESLNLLPYKWQRARRTRRNAPAFTQISVFPLFIFAAVATMTGFADANHGKVNSDCSPCQGCMKQPHCAAGLICTKSPAHGSDRSYCKTAPTVATSTATSTTTTATATTITSTASTTSATTTTTTTTTISPCQGWAASSVGDGDNTGETNVWGDDDGDGNSDVSYAAVGDGWCSHGTSESTGKGAKVTPYRIQAWTKDWKFGLSSCKSFCSKDKYCIGVTHYSKGNDERCYIHSCRAPKTNVWTLVSEENDGKKGKEYPADVRAITMASKEFFKDVDPGKKDEKKMQCHRRILPTTTATTTTTTVTASTTTTTTTADNCVLGDRVWADVSGFGNEDTKWASNITVLPPSPQTTNYPTCI